MGKPTAHRLSAISMAKGAKKLKKATNDTWKLAPKAPMFTRKSKNVEGKKKVVRTKRLIGGHTFKILASGGAAYAQSVLSREAKVFRVDIPCESKRSPLLPSVSPGAVAVLEQFVCAYAQQATRHAISVRQGLGHTGKDGVHLPLFKRLNGKLMKLGYDQADAEIFSSSMPVPRTLIVCKPTIKKKGKDGKLVVEEDQDYQGDVEPPDADN